MAICISLAVIRGHIDNRKPGKTLGKIWLAGRKEPLELDLEGDCLRDMAGCILLFENPTPEKTSSEIIALSTQQTGEVGDMTASRRTHIWQEASKGNLFLNLGNSLYIEWFSEENRRVFLDVNDFKVQISLPSWQMDEHSEQAQIMANQHAMREYIAGVLGDQPTLNAIGENNEDDWELCLRGADRAHSIYLEVFEKYKWDPDCQVREAFVMSWDNMLDEMARSDEEYDDSEDEPDDEDKDEEEEFFTNEYYWIPNNEQLVDEGFFTLQNRETLIRDFPLYLRLHSLICQIQSLGSIIKPQNGTESNPAREVFFYALEIESRLSIVLPLSAQMASQKVEKGFILAVLRRCVHWVSQALSSLEKIVEHDSVRIELTKEFLLVRDGLVSLRREIKKN